MRHPSEGVLRRLLDEPAGVADADRDHVARCEECLRGLAAIREDADLVHAALATEASADVDVAAAWRRLSAGSPATRRAPAAVPPRAGRLRAALRRPVVAGVAVAAVLTGAGTAAANGWLPIFRTEQVAPLSLSTADLNALPDLSAYGELAVTGDPDVRTVPDAATAAAETGLDVPRITGMPRGVTGAPDVPLGTVLRGDRLQVRRPRGIHAGVAGLGVLAVGLLGGVPVLLLPVPVRDAAARFAGQVDAGG